MVGIILCNVGRGKKEQRSATLVIVNMADCAAYIFVAGNYDDDLFAMVYYSNLY
jgi:hypothetical protein